MKEKKLTKLGLNKQTVAKLNDLKSIRGAGTDSCCTCGACTDTCCTCETVCEEDCLSFRPIRCTKDNSGCETTKLGGIMNTKMLNHTTIINTGGTVMMTNHCR